MLKYPERIYNVHYDGHIILYLRHKHESVCDNKNNTQMPYAFIGITEAFKGQEWTLKDYESEIKEMLSEKCPYSTFSLYELDKHLSDTDNIDYWTEDFDKAVKVSKERYQKYHPTGKSYDVVSYWDDCDRHVLNSEPLSYQDAKELCKKKLSTRQHGSLYHYTVEIHRVKTK